MRRRIRVFREIVITLVLGLILVSSPSIKTVNAQAGQVTLKPTDDNYVDSTNPNSNYGGKIDLDIENSVTGTPPYQLTYLDLVWLKFDLSTVPHGAIIDEATLQLHTSYVGETYNVNAYSCSDNSWKELTLTYSNMPSYSTISMDSLLVATSNQWYNWSTVDAVRNAMLGNPGTVTIVLQEPSAHSSATFVSFESKEAPVYFTDYSPKLTVHWSGVVPEFPTFLILPSFMITALLVVIFYKKRLLANLHNNRQTTGLK
jgi:hypothetical protein